jgi:hypothetical protein
VPLPSPAPSPLCVILFFKNLFPNLYGMANCWGVGLGREGLHERHTHAHHTARTRRPRAGVGGTEGGELAGSSFPQALPSPLEVRQRGRRPGGGPALARTVPQWEPGARRFTVAGEGFFVLGILLAFAREWVERAKGSFWSFPAKRTKGEPLPTRNRGSGTQTQDAKMQTHRRHTHTTHPHTRNFTFLL